jgi:predicted permease
MRWLAEVRERVRGLLFRGREDADRDDELREHVEMQVQENQRRGMSPAEARRQAAISFGGIERVREEVREARGLALMEEWTGDIRYALRALRRNPGFTAVALLTLALGLGANSAMFSVVNGILLRPLPHANPDELVLLYQSSPRTGELLGRISYEDMLDWSARTRSLSSIAAYAAVPTILTGHGDPVEVEMSYVTDTFFDVLGIPVAQGRPLQDDDHGLAQSSAVISDALWRTHLGGAPGVTGSSILLRGEPYTVVGVMPPVVPQPTPGTAVWVPRSLVQPNMFANGMPTRSDRYLQGIARLAPGATAEEAQRELTALSAQLAADYPESNEDWNAAAVVPLQTSIVGDVDQALMIVLGVVGFILLIGCANLANLLLARGSARGRELAVRAALGAGRRRLVRQLLTESLVLAFLGGVLGLVLCHWGVQTILALSADTLPRMEDVRVDVRVIVFGLVLAGITGVVFGLVPALRLAHTDPQHGLRGGRGTVGTDGRRLRAVLVVAEVALAVLLVIGAGLMARSFLALRSVDPGFNPDNVLTVAMQINYSGVPEQEIGRFIVQRREDILSRVRELPGVDEAGMINVFPLRQDGAPFSLEYTRGGADATPGEPGVRADTRYVDPGYLPAMGIPLLRGEQLPFQLREGAPLPVLMSESAARRLWPDADPLGRLITAPGGGESVVVGIVGDVRQIGLAWAPPPAVYFPQLIAPRLLATLVVRTAGEPMALAAPIRQVIREVDPNQPIRTVASLKTVLVESIARDRFFTLLFAIFGSLALTLAGVGIYGVLAYSVRQRTQEIGVRMALGARAIDVLRLVSGGGMKLVAIGAVIGTAAALMLSRVLASQLYGITPTDPLTFAAAVLFLGVIALLAIYIPARRATRVAPMIALRPD